MSVREPRTTPRCPVMMGRRGFLTSLGASALAAKMGLFDFASELFAAQPKPAAAKPVVRAVFLRPDLDRYWMGWPGASYDVKASQALYVDHLLNLRTREYLSAYLEPEERAKWFGHNVYYALYTKTLTEAADRLGVQLEVQHKPLTKPDEINAWLEQVKKAPPDGLIATVMHLGHWRNVNHLVANKGDVPAIVFSPMGTSFTAHLQPTRNAARTFVGATQEVGWLASGLRMLHTVWAMKRTRILVARGKQTVERPLAVIGSTLRYIPRDRFVEVFKKTEASDEMRQLAEYYKKEARKIVEPNAKDVLDGARAYVACRKLMAAERCDGYAMDCLGIVSSRTAPPPCLAFAHLRDLGIVGACEADWNAAISSRLTHLLFDRPGFMQDPAPNSVNNTLMGAHCTCATKLAGFDKPHEPFILRSHSESNHGVTPQVLWKLGQKCTVMKFQGPNQIILGTGTVVANIDTPPSGGCRTSVELALDDIADARDAKGFHQLFIYGDLERPFKAYCQLAGIKVVHL